MRGTFETWVLTIAMLLMAFGLTSCGGKVKEKTKDAVTLQGESIQSSAVDETPVTDNTEAEETIWLCFDELDFAMKLPKSVAGNQPAGEVDERLIFQGENDSLCVELRKWDQVSLPREAALAELVAKATGAEAELLERNGRGLIRVNWPHGEVNYYLMDEAGDAYYLWITPYVMKDPDVYEKVRTIEESFRKMSDVPGNEEVMRVELKQPEEIDYLVLVNKKNPLPEGWEEKLDLVTTVNSVGDLVPVDRTAYKAYLELKEYLFVNEGIDLDLDSAYRSVAYQQDILERFTEKYGAAYAAKTVAKPGYSEHHTGLALDLYFMIDGVEVYENEDLIQYPEVWKKIHERLADHGFILRYPGGKNGTVDYTYEPWHIRYVGVEAAREIASSPGMTLEDYLDGK